MWRKLALPPILVAVTLAATGWLYVVRAGGLPGPRVREALPLDELAKHSSAPLLLFIAVWVAAGVTLGAAVCWARVQRSVAVIACALGPMLVVYVATGTSVAVARQVAARAALHTAERLGAVYLPAVLVALAVALIARPSPGGRRSPAIVALVVAAAASLELLHTILPGSDEGVLRSLTPDAAGPLSHAACCFAGVALLFAARGLARRRRRAWEVAVAVAVLSTVLHVLHGAGHGTTLRFAGREIASALLGLHLRGSPHLSGPFGAWFPLSVFLMGVGATVWIVSGWLAPWRHRVRQEAADRGRVERLVRERGVDTLSPFTLRQDKSYFLNDEGTAFIAYRVVGGVAIVSGDPVGEPEAFEALVDRFLEHARR